MIFVQKRDIEGSWSVLAVSGAKATGRRPKFVLRSEAGFRAVRTA